MRIDLPSCSLKTCKYYFDGNCTDKNKYDVCEYTEMVKAKSELEKFIDELNQPINSLYDAALLLCMSTSLASGGCRNCPVALFNYDKRTRIEKCYHEPCQTNIYKWLIDQAKVASDKGE